MTIGSISQFIPPPQFDTQQVHNLENASQQIEALLFRQVLEKALKPVFKSNLLSESNASDTYRSFLVDGLSQSIATTHPLQLDQYLNCAHHEK